MAASLIDMFTPSVRRMLNAVRLVPMTFAGAVGATLARTPATAPLRAALDSQQQLEMNK